MKFLIWFVLSAALFAQAPGIAPAEAGPTAAVLSQKDVEALATRMLQLMESTAVATPGLARASEPVQQNAQMTFSALLRTPQVPALIYQFVNQIKAYQALSEAIPRPYPFPETADRQYAELREDLQRIQQHFEAVLQVQNVATQARDADRDNLKRYQDANNKVSAPTNLPRVVLMGDSITDFWRLNEYFGTRDFVNRGISGQVTAQMLGRFKQDVLDLRPKAVVILAGTNDISREIPLRVIENNLSMMADLASANNVQVALSSVLPVSDYHKDVKASYEMTKNHPPDRIVTLNQWIKSYCDLKGYTFVDYFGVMADEKGQLKADLADDGLHPNAKGYRVMSPVALEGIGRALSQARLADDPAGPKKRFKIN